MLKVGSVETSDGVPGVERLDVRLRRHQRALRVEVREQEVLELEVQERVEPAVGVVGVLHARRGRRPRRSSRRARRRSSWWGWRSSSRRARRARRPSAPSTRRARRSSPCRSGNRRSRTAAPSRCATSPGSRAPSRWRSPGSPVSGFGRGTCGRPVTVADSVRKSGSEASCRVSSVVPEGEVGEAGADPVGAPPVRPVVRAVVHQVVPGLVARPPGGGAKRREGRPGPVLEDAREVRDQVVAGGVARVVQHHVDQDADAPGVRLRRPARGGPPPSPQFASSRVKSSAQ